MTSAVTVVISGYDSPEGPAFDRDGNLYFVNWLSSSIVRLTPEGVASEFFNTGGIPAGLAFHRDGSLYVADEGDDIHGVLRIADGRGDDPRQRVRGQPLNGANDLVFDRDGVLYFSDPWRSSRENPIGGFYRYSSRMASGADRPPVWPFPTASRSARTAQPSTWPRPTSNRILRYPIGADGSIGPREDFALLPGGEGPDGMAFDEAGNLYVAHYGGGKVAVFGPQGETDRRDPRSRRERHQRRLRRPGPAHAGHHRRRDGIALPDVGSTCRGWRFTATKLTLRTSAVFSGASVPWALANAPH